MLRLNPHEHDVLARASGRPQAVSMPLESENCPTCRGHGYAFETACPFGVPVCLTCKGTGKAPVTSYTKPSNRKEWTFGLVAIAAAVFAIFISLGILLLQLIQFLGVIP